MKRLMCIAMVFAIIMVYAASDNLTTKVFSSPDNTFTHDFMTGDTVAPYAAEESVYFDIMSNERDTELSMELDKTTDVPVDVGSDGLEVTFNIAPSDELTEGYFILTNTITGGAVAVTEAIQNPSDSAKYTLSFGRLAWDTKYRLELDSDAPVKVGNVIEFTTSPKPTFDGPEWQIPSLVNPIIRYLGVNESLGTLQSNTDYIIVLPQEKYIRELRINGGRNVVVVGGNVHLSNQRVPVALVPNPTWPVNRDNGADSGGNNPQWKWNSDADGVWEQRGIYIMPGNPATRTVHIEGVHITFAKQNQANGLIPGIQADAIATNAPDTTLQLVNVRVDEMIGGYARAPHEHADFIQTWGGIKELRVHNFTGDSSYQGFFLTADSNKNGHLTFRNVNLTATPSIDGSTRGGYMIWLDQKSSPSPPTEFYNVYVKPRPAMTTPNATARTLANSIYPDGNFSTVALRPHISSGYATWPAHENVIGGIHEGTPPDGDFVPKDVVGPNYSKRIEIEMEAEKAPGGKAYVDISAQGTQGVLYNRVRPFFITAAYHNNKLIGIDIRQLLVGIGDPLAGYMVTFNNLGGVDWNECEVKTFVWENLNNMTPY